MAAEVENKTLIQNETIILKRECRSKEIFKQLRYLNCLKKEILNSNFYTYYTRGIDSEVVNFYYLKGYIYECQSDHSVVFVGYDEKGKERFASKRATNDNWKKDVYGSDKHYSFRLVNATNDVLHVFESPIDLMSFQTLEKQKGRPWKHENYLSLGGASNVGKDVENSVLPIALEYFLMNNKQVKEIILHLDNDRTGYETSEKIKHHLSGRYEITDRAPRRSKDVNELLLKYYRSNCSIIK